MDCNHNCILCSTSSLFYNIKDTIESFFFLFKKPKYKIGQEIDWDEGIKYIIKGYYRSDNRFHYELKDQDWNPSEGLVDFYNKKKT